MMAVTSLIRERGMRFWRTTGSKTNGSSRVIPTRKRQQEGKQARVHGASSGRRADRHLLHQRGVFTVSGKDFAQILEPALPEPGRVSFSGRDRKGGGGRRGLLDGRRCRRLRQRRACRSLRSWGREEHSLSQSRRR